MGRKGKIAHSYHELGMFVGGKWFIHWKMQAIFGRWGKTFQIQVKSESSSNQMKTIKGFENILFWHFVLHEMFQFFIWEECLLLWKLPTFNFKKG